MVSKGMSSVLYLSDGGRLDSIFDTTKYLIPRWDPANSFWDTPPTGKILPERDNCPEKVSVPGNGMCRSVEIIETKTPKSQPDPDLYKFVFWKWIWILVFRN